MFWLLITFLALWLLKKGLEKAQACFQGLADDRAEEAQAFEDVLRAERWLAEDRATEEEKRRIREARDKYAEFREQDYEAQVRAEIESMTRGG